MKNWSKMRLFTLGIKWLTAWGYGRGYRFNKCVRIFG